MSNKVIQKQVSILNTFWIIEYLKNNFPDTNFSDILTHIQTENLIFNSELENQKD